MTVNISTSLSTRMRPETAQRRIEAFRRRFSQAHYYFAQHAAFPLALTADLLYRMWASFQHTTTNISLDVPWLAVADLLLSPLCQETDTGYELYEMDVSIRAQLLNELQDNPHFGLARIEELSGFLRDYVQEQLKSPDPVILDLAQSQRWTALAYTRPGQTAKELAELLKIHYNNGSLEQVRIASLLETFGTLSEPLATVEGFEPLLTYAQAQAHTVLGHRQSEDTTARIQQASEQVSASLGIDLPTTRRGAESEGAEETQQETAIKTDFYISHHIADHDSAQWIAQQLQKEGYTVTWSFEYGPASSLDIDTTTLHTQANYTLALLSQEYMSIDNVQNEWTAILAESQQQGQRLLLPLRVRECTPQGIFASIQYLDLVKQSQDVAREELLQFIRESLNKSINPFAAQKLDTANPINVFISYAREDEALLNQLSIHLVTFKLQQLIADWHTRQILPGTNWSSEIDTHMEQSKLILLLISPYFMASDYSYGIEMKQALDRHEVGKARVIPIILRPVDWVDAPFSKLQFLPSNAAPISRWPDRDDAFTEVVKGLRRVIREIQALPKTKEEWLEEGNALDGLQRYEEAISAFDQAIRLSPNYAAVYNYKGDTLFTLHRYEEAIQAYTEALRLQPEDAYTLFALSRLYNDMDDYEQAIAVLDQLVGLQPEFADAYKQRGWVYRRQADAEFAVTGDGERRAVEYKRAIVDFERAVELRPDFEDALGSLGGLYRRLGDFERAVEYYQRQYAVNPSSSYALGNLASLSWYLGHVEDARRYFDLLEGAAQARIEAGKDEAYWDYYDLALGRLATGELAAARETYAKAIEETPAIAQLDAVLNNLYFLQRAAEHIEGLEEIIAMIENAKDVKGAGEA
ncbi:MAG: TIR domain-containing protein [Ktedonobacteraceae bacterium]|nr:TIR domain-containing protein [Ktedonobacteraceae bacterium]